MVERPLETRPRHIPLNTSDLAYSALVTHGNALLCRGVEPSAGFTHRTRLPFWKSRFRVSRFDGDEETVLATHPGTWLRSLRDDGCLHLKFGYNRDTDNVDVVGTYRVRDNCEAVVAAYFSDRVEYYASAEQPVKPKWGFLVTQVAVRSAPAKPRLPRSPEASKAALHRVFLGYHEFEVRMRGDHRVFHFDRSIENLYSSADDVEFHCGWPMSASQILPPEAYPAVCRHVMVACLGAVFPGGWGADLTRYGDPAADSECARLQAQMYAERDRCFPDMINFLLTQRA